MDKIMEKNICIIGLLNNYTSKIANDLSKELDCYYANISKLVEFDIVDVSNTIEICGLDYYKQLVVKKIKEVSEYENTIASVEYYMLQYDNAMLYFNNFITIYLSIDEDNYNSKISKENLTELEQKLEKGVYQQRDIFYKQKCKIVVDCNNKTDEEIVQSIIASYKEFIAKGVN